MRGKKVYGQSQINLCPFCGNNAVTKTSQGVPCCITHKKAEMPNMKCACGDWLDVCEGKWGAYFRCLKCGNISFSKGLEINDMAVGNVLDSNEKASKEESSRSKQSEPEEIVVTSDEVDFIYEKFH